MKRLEKGNLSGENYDSYGNRKCNHYGMRCAGCSAAVEDALNRLEHVNADVDLRKKEATVRMDADVSEEVLTGAVVRAGYKVIEVR